MQPPAKPQPAATALLTAPELMTALVTRRPAMRCLVARGNEAAPQISAQGIATGESF